MFDIPHASMKQCAGECQQFLPATSEYFSCNKNRKDKLQTLCKSCMAAYKKLYYLDHKEQISQKGKVYRESHKEQCAERWRRYVEEHREEYLTYQSQYYQAHREQELEQRKLYYQANGETIRKRVNRYRLAHREQISEYKKLHSKLHKEEISEQRKRRYHAHREEIRAQKKHSYQKHKERQLEWTRQYRHTERGRIVHRNSWHRRELRKKAIECTLTTQQIQAKLKAQKYRCYYTDCGHAKFEKRNGQYVYHLEHTIPLSRTEMQPRHDVNYVVLACPACNLKKGTKLPHEFPEGGRLF